MIAYVLDYHPQSRGTPWIVCKKYHMGKSPRVCRQLQHWAAWLHPPKALSQSPGKGTGGQGNGPPLRSESLTSWRGQG